MQNLGKIIFLMCMGVLTSYAITVKAVVETQEVVKGNPVQLRLIVTGGDASFPVIRDVAGYRILSRSSNSEHSLKMVNGTVTMIKKITNVITFLPTENMTIPSYTINVDGQIYETQPIAIKIVNSNAPQVSGHAQYSFILKSDKKSMMVGESFIVSAYVSVDINLKATQFADYIEPTSPGFFFKSLGKEKQYEENGYHVVEMQYIATAKKEGTFSIAPASIKIGIENRRRQDIFGRYGIRWIPAISNSLDIEVKAPAKDTDLIGIFKLNARIDKQKTKVNKPINLVVTIAGQGNLEDFNFEKYEIDGVTIYSDEAKVSSRIDNEILKSSYSKNFVFIADGDFTIPSRTITVYDTQTQSEKSLVIPSYKIKVTQNKSLAKNPVITTPKGVVKDKKSLASKSKGKLAEKVVSVKSTGWGMLVSVFILGMLVLYLIQMIPSFLANKKKNPYKEDEALKILYAHISKDKKVETMVRKLYARKNGDKSIEIDKKELKAMVESFR